MSGRLCISSQQHLCLFAATELFDDHCRRTSPWRRGRAGRRRRWKDAGRWRRRRGAWSGTGVCLVSAGCRRPLLPGGTRGRVACRLSDLPALSAAARLTADMLRPRRRRLLPRRLLQVAKRSLTWSCRQVLYTVLCTYVGDICILLWSCT